MRFNMRGEQSRATYRAATRRTHEGRRENAGSNQGTDDHANGEAGIMFLHDTSRLSALRVRPAPVCSRSANAVLRH
jgi:hypothetical protein